ncbi:MAG: S-layer homology domain-containing protein [Syntrophomonadaceae bacterium]|jgi:hypothetical protein|nr:S-layer homology domain-containing protein [Syntrophomonadaceae bacterium]
MKTLIKIFLCTILITFMACETSGLFFDDSNAIKTAEQVVYTQEEIPTLKLSYNPELGLEIRASSDRITVFVPSDQVYTSIMLILSDFKDNEIYQKVSRRQQQGGLLAADFSTDYLADGTYYLAIYSNSGNSNTYSSIVYKHDIPMNRTAGKWSFNVSPAFANNNNIFYSKRTDSNALAFYTLASINVQSKAPEIQALAKQIAGGLSDPYEKALAIHDWVCNNIWYDFDSLSNLSPDTDTSALNTLITSRGICEGYASLTAALLRAQGIPAKLVHGYALGITGGSVWTDSILSGGETNHTWNEAFLNNRWVIIDNTWDSANVFENGAISNNNGLRNRRYFDASLEAFSIDHLIQEYSEENIPDIGISDILAANVSPWAETGLQQAYTEGLIPDNLASSLQSGITREEFCTLAVNFISQLTGKSIETLKNELIADGVSLNPDHFEDTRSETVLLASIYGITEGTGNRRFNPNGLITREQAAVMLHRLGRLFGFETPSGLQSKTFDDFSLISDWAVDSVDYITTCFDPVDKVYVMSGTSPNIFDPHGFYTREQSVITMLRLHNFIKFSS